MKKSLLILGSILVGTLLSFNNCTGFKAAKYLGSLELLSLEPGFIKINRESVNVLPFDVRISKIQYLIGTSEATLFSKLESRKLELGAFNYSAGISQVSSWTDSKVLAWLDAVNPICVSPQIRAKFPFPAKAPELIAGAYGRAVNATDTEVINSVNALSITSDEKLEIFCQIILTSLEFVAL